jgi:O-antigen/teichoic acid export membrane protein
VSLAASLFLVPAYIHFLSPAAFGLVGFLTTLQMILLLADAGVSAGLNREMARITAGTSEWRHGSELIGEVQRIYAGAALLVVVTCRALTPVIRTWLHSESLPAGELETAVLCTGIIAAASLWSGLYGAALLGTQHHLLYNVATTSIVLLRGGGTVLLFLMVGASTRRFFFFQAAATGAGTLILFLLARPRLPANARPVAPAPGRFRRFMTGAGGISLSTSLGIFLTTQDRFVLGHFCSLSAIGAYSAAGALASLPLQITGPLTQTVFPRLAELRAFGDRQGLERLYLRGMSMICATVIPVGVFLIVCGSSLLLAWTRKPQLVSLASPTISFLALGFVCQAVAGLTYNLELVHGTPKLALVLNTFQAITAPVFLFVLTPRIGILAGGLIWAIINATYVLIYVPLVHRKFAPASTVPVARVILVNVAISLCVAVPARMIVSSWGQSSMITLLFLAAAGAVCAVSTWMVDAHTRAITARVLGFICSGPVRAAA